MVLFFAPDTDAFVESVCRHLDEFTEQTGIVARTKIIPSDAYFSNDIHAYLDGEDAADVFMSGPVLLWEHIGAGYVEPLDDFVSSASEHFDFADFFPSLIAANRWTGQFGAQLGTGTLWEIPVNCEAYNLAYVPATLERLRCDVPQTWADYFDIAGRIAKRSDNKVRGFGQRGVQVWHTMYTGYATQFWAYGATDFDADGKCAIASPQGIAATTDFIDALRVSGPADWLNQRWYELARDFATEIYGLIVDSDHYTAMYENPEMSLIHGRTGYALPPLGPTGERVSNLWTWSLVMNSRSAHKHDAWRFIEWASSKAFLLRSAFEGNMNPTRKSIWDHERFRQAAKGWGDFYDVGRRLIAHDAKVLVTPTPHYLRLADRWVAGIRSAFSRECSVAEALESAAADIDKLVREN